MAQLTTFYTSASNDDDDEGLNEDGEGYITADSDELEEEGAVDVGLGYGGDSDDDEEALAPTRLAVPQGATIELMSEDEDDEDDDQESVSESSSSDEDGKIDLMDMEDESDEEAGAAGPSVPPKTKHELEDDRAAVPQVEMLKEGERLVLAGEIMSVLLNAGVKHEPEVKVEPEVEVEAEVDVKAAEEAKTEQAEAGEDAKPEITPQPALDPSTTDLDPKSEPVAATAAAAKPKPVKKDAKTKQREKREQKQLAKSSGTIIIKALRPPLGEAGIGGLRIGDDEGWLEEGSLICLENRRVLAVVSINGCILLASWQHSLTDSHCRSPRRSDRFPSRSTFCDYLQRHTLFRPPRN